MDALHPPATHLVAATEGGHHIVWEIFAYFFIVLLAMAAFIVVARRGFNQRIFRNPVSQAAEQAYVFIENLCVGVIGEHGRKYVPFIATLWMYILTANILGLVLPHTPTADWSLNLGMAIIVFAYFNYEGWLHYFHNLTHKGMNGLVAGFYAAALHIRHFAGPKLPVYLGIFLYPVIFSIEVLSALIRIPTLSLRLYGNVEGGHLVKGTLDQMGGSIPLGALVLPLEFLVAIVQSLVFVLLTCIYIQLVTHHEDEEHVERSQEQPVAA